MDRTASPKRPPATLYPPTDPFDQRMIEMGDGHVVYMEQCGNPEGQPVIVLHGGPGGGCSPMMRRFFDPQVYRIVLFDQRGCGRSRPYASVEANTTQHLIGDIERIRKALGIDVWMAFGGSWGATLALLYAEAHPERVSALVLRGVFLMTQAELDWFYGGGAGRFFPDLWQRFANAVPERERDDLIAAYHRRLFSGNLQEEIAYGRLWAGWENALASIDHPPVMGDGPADYVRAFSRLENHYFTHRGFLEQDDQIVARAAEIAHIPTRIVQGRHDMVCPPVSAWRLAERLPRAQLRMIPLAGHALSEPGIAAELIRATDDFRL
ncbi:prolyl aminopeptidase [Haematobacter massiliensis]|uniref:Proline iminopeptidase n=1 Tax=Haematobacter massiliensis TaxID=195105 RepID=A0A086Y8L7_9RHOB|nr:prolyl aminopeptidase [Haematobacter massiliensis]KFI30617.1 proline iminopeptidase [Haematobacter massiliensis]OWJ71508.1 prolyl aminopeptidase [Haematobacter massiliensis]OWJ81253.1 prolyl aminopeptidase [Haematobacter massiliensis]QBJ25086.1 prolyl aminopeptidase [Haematobacter massiliensis]